MVKVINLLPGIKGLLPIGKAARYIAGGHGGIISTVPIWGSVNSYDFPRVCRVTAFHFHCFHLEFAVNP